MVQCPCRGSTRRILGTMVHASTATRGVSGRIHVGHDSPPDEPALLPSPVAYLKSKEKAVMKTAVTVACVVLVLSMLAGCSSPSPPPKAGVSPVEAKSI